jgi:uncharacterized protein YaiI (UPF0178 family)
LQEKKDRAAKEAAQARQFSDHINQQAEVYKHEQEAQQQDKRNLMADYRRFLDH